MSRTARTIAGLVLIGVAVGIATGGLWSSTASATEQVGERIDTIQIDNDSGNVSIRADDVSSTQVRQRFSYRFGRPDVRSFEVDGTTLRLDGCGWWCSVDYDVVVPVGTEVTGRQDSGNLTLTGVAGVDAQVDSGTVTLADIAGPVTLDMDSGDLEATGLRDTVDLTLDSGNADLQLTAAADVTVDMDSGDFALTVPDEPFRVTGETDSGERTFDITQDPDAEHVLDITADSGDVTVRTN